MFKLTNYINIFIFISLLFLVITFDSFSKISTKLETILPNTANKELLKEFSKFKGNKELFLSYKEQNKNSLKELKKLEKEIVFIKGLSLKKFTKNQKLQEYNEQYKLYKSDLNKELFQSLNIKKSLEHIKYQMIHDDFGFTLKKKDPFNLYKEKQQNLSKYIKNSHLALKDYGYLSIFTIDNSIDTMPEYEQVYSELHNILKAQNNKEEIKVFSSMFYFVENSQLIKNDVNKIILISTILLILLYIVILRNIKLLFNTLLTLSSSVLLSLLISTFIFKELSIFVLVFGVSISTVAIDYMFHHYMHEYYESKKGFNTSVFFGMITTVGAFFIISFLDFDLIRQISYFAIFSLIFSYLQFSFLYPKIKFVKPKNTLNIKNIKSIFYIKASVLTIISVLVIIICLQNIQFDLNIKNLDTKNTKLQEVQDFFYLKLKNKKRISVLITANTLENLLNNAKELKRKYSDSYIPLSTLLNKSEFLKKQKELQKLNLLDFRKNLNKEAKNLGFKENTFSFAYKEQKEFKNYTLEDIKNYGFEIRKYKKIYITYALVNKSKEEEIYKLDFVKSLSVKNMFEKSLATLYNQLLILGSLSIVFILFILFLTCRKNYLLAINFILFPMALILFSSFFISFNILHLFMLFIILAISIDFGIYLSKEDLQDKTKEAIFYSLLSTFAGFGVLIFSNIYALFSIGLIAIIGLISLIILLLFTKKVLNDSKGI